MYFSISISMAYSIYIIAYSIYIMWHCLQLNWNNLSTHIVPATFFLFFCISCLSFWSLVLFFPTHSLCFWKLTNCAFTCFYVCSEEKFLKSMLRISGGSKKVSTSTSLSRMSCRHLWVISVEFRGDIQEIEGEPVTRSGTSALQKWKRFW